MLTVTAIAQEKLKEALKNQKLEPGMTNRIIPSSSKPNTLTWTVDTEKEGDQVLKSKDGTKILLIAPDLASELEGMVMDYQDNSEISGFVVTSRLSGE